MRHRKLQVLALCTLLILAGAGCKKKPAPAAPPAPPPPAPMAAKPTASLTVNPTSIERGQSTTIEWSTSGATTVKIEPELGTVQASGSRSIRPGQSTTYHLTAAGPGGTADASARVTVTTPPPAPPPPTPAPPPATPWGDLLRPIYFDYDKADIRDDQRANLEANGKLIMNHSDVMITIEGNCDERGSAEYNLGLGDRRANAIKESLVKAGVAADHIHTISYGKERPSCSVQAEECWQKNRRGDLKTNR